MFKSRFVCRNCFDYSTDVSIILSPKALKLRKISSISYTQGTSSFQNITKFFKLHKVILVDVVKKMKIIQSNKIQCSSLQINNYFSIVPCISMTILSPFYLLNKLIIKSIKPLANSKSLYSAGTNLSITLITPTIAFSTYTLVSKNSSNNYNFYNSSSSYFYNPDVTRVFAD